jgi:hypothetical protein
MPSLFFGLCAFTIVCCLVVGGGGGGSHLADGILQFLSLPLAVSRRIVDLRSPPPKCGHSGGTRLLCCGCPGALLQLVLPPLRVGCPTESRRHSSSISWAARCRDADSVSPEATAAQRAVAFAAHRVPRLPSPYYRERRRMSLVVLAVGLVSVFLALVQVSRANLW